MHLSAILLGALITTATCESVNTTQEYHLKTRLKPHQSDKERFDKLYLYTWSGSIGRNGMSDVVFESEKDQYCAKGFLSSVANSTVADDNSQQFVVGTNDPYVMTMAEGAGWDTAWQSVRFRRDYEMSSPDAIENGFFINSTGLQWTLTPGKAGTPEDSFGGWLVCDWWHLEPQLFFRNKFNHHYSTPKSCAEVFLTVHLSFTP
ncbi:hypothetical protein LTS10_000505 [Elasticomyces elasticus]|nr:hypothetical protein LTS10_000505 [Elasticomyces elasticus]